MVSDTLGSFGLKALELFKYIQSFDLRGGPLGFIFKEAMLELPCVFTASGYRFNRGSISSCHGLFERRIQDGFYSTLALKCEK